MLHLTRFTRFHFEIGTTLIYILHVQSYQK